MKQLKKAIFLVALGCLMTAASFAQTVAVKLSQNLFTVNGTDDYDVRYVRPSYNTSSVDFYYKSNTSPIITNVKYVNINQVSSTDVATPFVAQADFKAFAHLYFFVDQSSSGGGGGAGSATSAKQDAQTAVLTSIDGKTPVLGAAAIAASVPVNIANNQVVPVSATALPLPFGASTSANQVLLQTSTTSIDGKTPALGQSTMTGSQPVVIASNQTAIDVKTMDLVKIPVNSLDYQSFTIGSAAVFRTFNSYENTDGTGGGLSMYVPAGIMTNAAQFKTVIWGRVIGFRFRRVSGLLNFGIVIDGEPYSIPPSILAAQFDNSQTGKERECDFNLRTDLPDGPHSVSINVYPNATTANTLLFYGFLAERSAGYKEEPRVDIFGTQQTITTTATVLPTLDANGNVLKSIKSVLFYNPDTVPHNMQLLINGLIFTNISVAAGASGAWSPAGLGVSMGGSTNLSIKMAEVLTTTAPTAQVIYAQ